MISRTAHRDNSSHYYIDDRKSSFGEVTALLKGKGVDLDNNRFLILQARGCGSAGRDAGGWGWGGRGRARKVAWAVRCIVVNCRAGQ